METGIQKERKVLVVDDEAHATKLMSSILEEEYQVITASSAKEAWDKMETASPDIVTTDVRMPGEDGISLLKRIKDRYPKIPVILITGHGDKSLAIDAVRAGAFDFLEKPHDEEDLLSAVERAKRNLELMEQLERTEARSLSSERLASLGTMAGGVAHEINTPLGAILLSVESIETALDSDPLDKEYIKTLIKSVKGVVNKIATIVKALRSFSRDSSNDPFLDTPVGSILEGIVSLSVEKLRNKSIQLTVDESFKKDVVIQCHESQIGQVIFNIINNAADAIENQNDKWIKVSLQELEKDIEITIQDSGKGVPKDIQQKIFDPFFTTKEIGKGTGLGLSISKNIIEAHHGDLSIDSSKPNTTFVIRLPKIQPLEG